MANGRLRFSGAPLGFWWTIRVSVLMKLGYHEPPKVSSVSHVFVGVFRRSEEPLHDCAIREVRLNIVRPLRRLANLAFRNNRIVLHHTGSIADAPRKCPIRL